MDLYLMDIKIVDSSCFVLVLRYSVKGSTISLRWTDDGLTGHNKNSSGSFTCFSDYTLDTVSYTLIFSSDHNPTDKSNDILLQTDLGSAQSSANVGGIIEL